MAKIVNFLEARRKFELAGLVSALKWEQSRDTPPEPEKPYAGPTKRPLIVSALPGETIPPEFPDFRPLLQRDGLILLGWSRWDRAPYYYKGKSPCYAVNWITSAPNRYHRRYTSGYITEEEISTARPDGTGDSYFLLGIRGKIYDFKNVHDKDVADYVFTCAPWDLNKRTIPGFIEKLKASGVTADFDFPYSIEYVKKLEFVAVLQECKVMPPYPRAWGKVEL